MAVIVSKNSNLNDDLWNEWSDQLIAVIQDTDTEQNDADDFYDFSAFFHIFLLF